MAQVGATGEAGHARCTYRLRVSAAARTALGAEWDRCRWVWNECMAKSKAVHLRNQATGQKATCGPAQLDRMLTDARARTPWLREGSSVCQQQVIRDFGRSRAKAHKDIEARLPMARRAGMPTYKKKREAAPTLNYTKRGFRLKDGRLHLAGGIVVAVVWSRELPAQPSSVRLYQDSLGHWYASFVVPAHAEPLPRTGRVLGIDWGVKETATTTSDAHDLPPRRARQEGPGAAGPVRPDDGPPQTEEGTTGIEGLPRGEETAGEGAQKGRQAAGGHRPQVGQEGGPRPRRHRGRGLPPEVPGQDHHGPQGR